MKNYFATLSGRPAMDLFSGLKTPSARKEDFPFCSSLISGHCPSISSPDGTYTRTSSSVHARESRAEINRNDSLNSSGMGKPCLICFYHFKPGVYHQGLTRLPVGANLRQIVFSLCRFTHGGGTGNFNNIKFMHFPVLLDG